MKHPFIARQRRRRKDERERAQIRAALTDIELHDLGLLRLKRDLLAEADHELSSPHLENSSEITRRHN